MIKQEVELVLNLDGTITTGDGKLSWKAPYAGELIAVGGDITTLGSGAGTSTDVQVRNSTQAKDMLSTVGAFEVNSATNLLEAAVVNQANCAFAKNDVLMMDVDAISTGPANARIRLFVVLFMDDL